MELKINRNGKVVCSMSLKKMKNGDIQIEYVGTDKDFRGNGFASQLLKKAIAIANKSESNLVAYLDPAPGGLTIPQEEAWLKRYGFIKNTRYDFGGFYKPVMFYTPITRQKTADSGRSV